MPYLFLKKNKGFKKKLFSFLLRKKKQFHKLKKKENVRFERTLVSSGKKPFSKKTIVRKIQKQKKIGGLYNTGFLMQSNSFGQGQGPVHFAKFLKKRYLWLKKRFYKCFSKKDFFAYFQRFRFYRLFYKSYTETRFYESLYIRKKNLGECIRSGFFPIKPMHFEFCYRRCEGILLGFPQKWYTLSLVDPSFL